MTDTLESRAREFILKNRPWPVHIDEITSALTAFAASEVERALERAAVVADAHKGAAAKARAEKGMKFLGHLDDWEKTEILSEERGEDIAAAVIARNIRALKEEPAP